ncbi:MAG: hypothetical protein M1827_006101 [Pycnora praestabilis]|nr:MAG: hypothetical protein M1827_006101 [Pycnora praestabilis]
MPALHVCPACQSRLSHPLWRAGFQRSSRATFISFSDVQKKDASEASKIPEDQRATNRHGEKNAAKKYRIPKRPAGRDSLLEKLFAKPAGPLLNSPGAQKSVIPAQLSYGGNTLNIPETAGLEYNWLTELEHALLNDVEALSVSWKIFRENYDKDGSLDFRNLAMQYRIKSAAGPTFHCLLRSTIEAWSRETRPGGIPTPAEAARMYVQCGIMRNQHWVELLCGMLSALARKDWGRAVKAQIVDNVERTQGDQARLEDVLEVWKIFFDTFGPKTKDIVRSSPETQGEWSSLPDAESLKSLRGGPHWPKSFQKRFVRFIPDFPSSWRSRVIGYAAVVTFSLIHPQGCMSPSQIAPSAQALPFSRFMAHLLPYTDLDLSGAKRYLVNLEIPETFINQCLLEWEQITPQAISILVAIGDTRGTPEERNLAPARESQSVGMENSMLKRLGRALERTNLDRVEALWGEAQTWYMQAHEKSLTEDRITGGGTSEKGDPHLTANESKFEMPLKVYNHFLTAFMALRRPGRAIDVWNTMLSSGQQPTSASWSAMINGCHMARDAESLDSVWQKMTSSGVKPDIHCWTSRINGLFKCRKWERGMTALDDMGKIWKDAAIRARDRKLSKAGDLDYKSIGNIGEIVKPTVETANAAISGLLRLGKDDAARKVMLWADTFGIHFDVFTFNTLLTHSVRRGENDRIQRILQEMERIAIKPDVATFTILLDGLFRHSNLSSASPAEQEAAVNGLLEEMEASGIQANGHSYGTLIDRILKQDSNLQAAQSILDHMRIRGVKPTPQIYTSLVTYYFAQAPPDLAAIDRLWSNIRLEGGVVDLIFYDRMIEGFAKVGEVGKMINFLSLMSREGKTPGWLALIAILRALVQVGDWERAIEVVGDVESETGLFRNGVKGLKGEEEFWDLVGDLKGRGLNTSQLVRESFPEMPLHTH